MWAFARVDCSDSILTGHQHVHSCGTAALFAKFDVNIAVVNAAMVEKWHWQGMRCCA